MEEDTRREELLARYGELMPRIERLVNLSLTAEPSEVFDNAQLAGDISEAAESLTDIWDGLTKAERISLFALLEERAEISQRFYPLDRENMRRARAWYLKSTEEDGTED